jgi:hypothetical protein
MDKMTKLKIILWSFLLIVSLFSGSCDTGISIGDDEGPSTIEDLNFDLATRLLAWTAPGDDGNSGRARVYDIRFFQDTEVAELLGLSVDKLDTVPFSEIQEKVQDNFSEATQLLDEPEPDKAGTPENFLITRLDTLGTRRFFFVMEARDEVGNSSSPSNVVEGTTPLAFAEFRNSATESCFGEAIGSGDFNGDGTNDIAVGDPCLGRVYVFLGGNNLIKRLAEGGQFFDVASSGIADVTIIGNAGDMFGAAVTGIGNFEGDSADELAIGAPQANGGKGKVFIIFGKRKNLPSTIDFTNGAQADLQITGENIGDNFGFTIVDGTGVIGEKRVILIGAPGANSQRGKLYLFRAQDIESNASASNARAIFIGENTGDMFGFSIDQTGNFNDDKFDDFAVGAPGAGKVYVIFGDKGISGQKDLLVNKSGVVIIQGNPEDNFGFAISGGEDIDDVDVENRDGTERPDLFIGAPGSNMSTGSVFFYSGEDIESAKTTGTSPSFTTEFTGENPGDSFGASLSVIRDLNPEIDKDKESEGLILVLKPTNSDFAVGAPGASRVYLFFGRSNFPSSVGAGEANIILPLPQDPPPSEEFGSVVVNLGDVTGDSRRDGRRIIIRRNSLEFLEDLAVGGLGFIRVEF